MKRFLILAVILLLAGTVSCKKGSNNNPVAPSPVNPGPTLAECIVFSSDYMGGGVFIISSDGTRMRQLTFDGVEPSFSFDGQRIAFNRNGNIYTMNADGGSMSQVTNNGNDWWPSFSPDGMWLLFNRYVSGLSDEIFKKNLSGGSETDITNLAAPDIMSAWSPLGDRIVYLSLSTGVSITTMAPDGTAAGAVPNVQNADAWSAAWSPDATRFAFIVDDSASDEVYTIKNDGSELRRLTNDSHRDRWPVWSTDGNRIFFVSNRECCGYEIYSMDTSGGNIQRITYLNSDIVMTGNAVRRSGVSLPLIPTPTPTPTATNLFGNTSTPTYTFTSLYPPTSTPTWTSSPTSTSTGQCGGGNGTCTFTDTPTNTGTSTATSTITSTPSPTASFTITFTPTITATYGSIVWGTAALYGGSYEFACLYLRVNNQPVTTAAVTVAGSNGITFNLASYLVTTYWEDGLDYAFYSTVSGFDYVPGITYTIISSTTAGTAQASILAPGGITHAVDGSYSQWTAEGNEDTVQVSDPAWNVLYNVGADAVSPVYIPSNVYSVCGNNMLSTTCNNRHKIVSNATIVGSVNAQDSLATTITVASSCTVVPTPTPAASIPVPPSPVPPADTATFTPTYSFTVATPFTNTYTHTPTNTGWCGGAMGTCTPTDTWTVTKTSTVTSMRTYTRTPSNTYTRTSTRTPTVPTTPTNTPSGTVTVVPSPIVWVHAEVIRMYSPSINFEGAFVILLVNGLPETTADVTISGTDGSFHALVYDGLGTYQGVEGAVYYTSDLVYTPGVTYTMTTATSAGTAYVSSMAPGGISHLDDLSQSQWTTPGQFNGVIVTDGGGNIVFGTGGGATSPVNIPANAYTACGMNVLSTTCLNTLAQVTNAELVDVVYFGEQLGSSKYVSPCTVVPTATPTDTPFPYTPTPTRTYTATQIP